MQHPVMILGAHGGIGGALAETLSVQELILTARDASTITANGETHSLDVLDEASLNAFLEYCDGIEALSGFVYAVGSITLKPFSKMTPDVLKESFDLNIGAALRILQKLEGALKKGQGSVVLFSTVAVAQGFSNHTLISTAKGAVEGAARALAAEWAPHVRVNVIAPSLSDTPLASALTSSPQMAKAIGDMHAIPRLGSAKDSAAMAAFLLDADQSGWISGQVFPVDGGRSTLRIKG